ncbi:hypothetical protein [Flavobacterium sp. '19STA2R22 D10 B1']|uniref:hypothetical protein n=1 Tax=Flavobacterium aerium TaxID=3037261 RepID=UPI00278C4C61|nr:hypothetical protein [Flavobacterium sp. '19STA2R22 D10 B1']
MKKAFVLFLTFIFLALSSGFTKSIHICKGIKQETYFFNLNKEGQPCSKCAIKGGGIIKGCCKHETQVLKITEKAQKVTPDNPSIVKTLGVALPFHFFKIAFGYTTPKVNNSKFSYVVQSISLKNTLLYIYYCVYRI